MAKKISKRSNRIRAANRLGATAVEFAVASPIFFALFFGALEITRVNQISNTAEIAATEGARRGIIPGASAAECLAAATEELETVGIDSFRVRVFPTRITENTETVRVQIDVDLTPSNGIFVSGFFAGDSVRKSIELVREE